MKVSVTGAAGFIGFHVCRRLLRDEGCEVLGLDNLNDYYPVALKQARLAELTGLRGFRFVRADLVDAARVGELHRAFRPDWVIHLGAQGGVRYSCENPTAYVQSNVQGFLSVLEACRACPPTHLVYASSSSVYGGSARSPFSEDQATDQPLSFYAATKKSNEVCAFSYAHLYGLRVTGLRFFTVYGPWGRPDMTPLLFSRAILAGQPVRLFNEGKNRRDFTYIDDIVDGVLRVARRPVSGGDGAPARVFNLGHHRPVEMLAFVRLLEDQLGRRAVIELLPPQPGDMVETCADLTRVREAVGYEPRVSLETGLARLAEWIRRHPAVESARHVA